MHRWRGRRSVAADRSADAPATPVAVDQHRRRSNHPATAAHPGDGRRHRRLGHTAKSRHESSAIVPPDGRRLQLQSPPVVRAAPRPAARRGTRSHGPDRDRCRMEAAHRWRRPAPSSPPTRLFPRPPRPRVRSRERSSLRRPAGRPLRRLAAAGTEAGPRRQPRLPHSRPRLPCSRPRLPSSRPRLPHSRPRLPHSRPTDLATASGASNSGCLSRQALPESLQLGVQPRVNLATILADDQPIAVH